MLHRVVEIDRLLIEDAEIEANRRMSFGFRGPVQDENYKFNMILISCIGELAFQKYLISQKISFELVSDSFPGRELMISDEKFEVKSSAFETGFSHLNLIYNVQQYTASLRKKISFVVQVFIDGYSQNEHRLIPEICSRAYIAGFIEFERISDFPITSNVFRPNYKIKLDDLHDINSIVGIK